MVYRVQTEENRQHLSDFVDAIDATIRRIRTTIFQLNRSPQAHGGLRERLLDIVEEARPALGFAPHSEFSGPLDQALSHELADDVIAVAREALSNAARHAQASSVRLRVSLEGPQVTVEAIDDGCGIGSPTRSSGLANLRSRALRHAGDLDVRPRDGGGTHLTWTALSRLE